MLLKKEAKEEAATIYEKVLTLDPENQYAQYALSALQSAEKKKKQLALNSLLTKGKTDFDQGAYQDALVSYHAALNLDPSNQEALEAIAAIEEKQNDLHQIDALLEKGKQLIDQGNYREALTVLQKVFDFASNHPEADKLIATCQQKINEAERVAFLITEANTLLKETKLNQAIKLYRQVLEISPDHPTATEQLALAEQQKREQTVEHLFREAKARHLAGKYKQALNYLNKMVAIDPAQAKDQEVRGLINDCEQKLTEADRADDLLKAGIRHFDSGEWNLALENFHQIISLIPNHPKSAEYIAKIQKKIAQQELIDSLLKEANSDLSKKRYEMAGKSFRRIVDIDSNNQAAVQGLKLVQQAVNVQENPTDDAPVPPSSKPKASPRKWQLAVIAIALLLIAGVWYLSQSGSSVDKPGRRADFSQSATSAKEDMDLAKEKATEANAEILAGSSFLRALEAAETGDQEFDSGNYLEAKLSYNSAEDFFNKSYEEASQNVEMGAILEEKRKLIEPVSQAKKEMLAEQSRARQMGADTAVANVYTSGVEAAQQGDQDFEAEKYDAAQQAYESATGYFKQAKSEVRRKVLATKVDIDGIKDEVERAKQEMLSEKSKAEKAGAISMAKNLFDRGIQKEQLGNSAFIQENKESLAAAQNFFLDGKDLFRQSREYAANAIRNKSLAETARSDMQKAKMR